MEKSYSSLTVLFEPPFWVGIFELTYNGRYCASKVTFGAESPVTTEADGLAVFNVKPGTYSVSTEATAAYQAYTEESIEVNSELAKTITLVAIA